MGKFKRGLIMGGLLGAGLMWLNTTKHGKETKEKILSYAGDVYDDVKQKIAASNAWEKMTKNAYVTMVKDAVKKYANTYQLSEHVQSLITTLVSSQWNTLKKEMKKKGK
ncbi:MAG TPA: hypothetical protein DCY48_02375 [Candidatus Magasanikbacteria bacterium]|nr:MAG: hypothetical protein A3I74_01290 [Candidatus Magasanikbacteria bacterium RIFCSPLOWO2_02_FULL_47_16]OGH79925.1 MAG: hypothetical protein A3C10_01935 [Candidatus Magasanikbacteria bacterium RIFCSPHIGHO2_02_FULL_48_18]OGH81785.1 MAG: hypothetical protein A3G08_01575 [Candidatus Magasanikbacteria bacterium RIFCSPLOWO2_12_FULL_47_9b]HAZ28599.1 hypothetical protein [Candidatus Magasanikbacteria bacterium]